MGVCEGGAVEDAGGGVEGGEGGEGLVDEGFGDWRGWIYGEGDGEDRHFGGDLDYRWGV